MNATLTPREIDTQIAAAYADRSRAQAAEHSALNTIHYAIKDRKQYTSGQSGSFSWATPHIDAIITLNRMIAADTVPHGTVRDAQRALTRLTEAQDAFAAAQDRIADLDAEFAVRGGWTRFFIVTSSTGGHIHSSMVCSTCRPSTTYGWLPDVSGQTEAEAVKAHGAILCTVCFPTAPVEWTRGHDKPADTHCPGSGTWDYPRDTARLGYCTGNYGVCSHCDTRVTVTASRKLRKHQAPGN
jgi:hypothetical protein